MSKKVMAAALVLAAVGSMSACSGDGAAKPVATSPKPVSSAPSAVASPVADRLLTREEGAKKYLELVKPYNDELDKCMKVARPLWDKLSSTPDDFPKVRSACAGMGKVNRKFADDLGKVKWPAEAQADINTLIDENRADQLGWDELAKVRNHEDFFDPKHPLSEDGVAAPLVRAHLGLPPVEDVG
ncbi:hypothetical protein ACIF70_41965 [Actinacidiphila glaucinigra]|uniref:hypothetical protein n=1 Tax=Actinacidiphila glaucinigra TaxID=235986 RepID=UPI0037C9B2AE